MKHPEPWTGKGNSADARHFLAAFHNWASQQAGDLNTWDAVGNQWLKDEQKWISAVLNLMGEDAKTWALPHLEELRAGRLPFTGIWANFERDFKSRFMPQDIADMAREAIKKIKQGKMSVAEYQAQFDQYTPQSGWSDNDHRTRFYDRLNEHVKDALSLTDRPICTFTELRSSALALDTRLRQRDSEKKGNPLSSHDTPKKATHSDAMDIDTSRQQPSAIPTKLQRQERNTKQ